LEAYGQKGKETVRLAEAAAQNQEDQRGKAKKWRLEGKIS
jgi:hypothetical protein